MFPRIDKGPIEYDLQIGFAWNAERKKRCLRFLFHTIEEFHHFRYEISIEHQITSGAIEFQLKGLTTRGMGMPGVGRAEKSVDVFDASGMYTVSVRKPGDISNDFELRVKGERITLVRPISQVDAFLTIHIV